MRRARASRGRLLVRDASPAGDAVLDAALEIVVAHQGEKPSAAIRPLSKNLRQTLYQRLADRGVVRAEQGRILGVFPARRWPAQDASHEAEMRRLVAEALTQQAVPGTRTAALIALLHALGCEDKIVDPGNTACPNESSEPGLRRSPRAPGQPKPSTRRSRR